MWWRSALILLSSLLLATPAWAVDVQPRLKRYQELFGWAGSTGPDPTSLGTITGVTVATTGTICTGTDKLTTDSTGNILCATDQSGGGTSHNILSATHTDSTAASATRGDVIVANSSASWTRFAVGGSNTVLTANGTDPAWSATPTVTSLTATNTITGTIAVDTPRLENSTSTNAGIVRVADSLASSGTITGTIVDIATRDIRFAALNCTGNTNGGKLTTNASGVVSCSDDASGAGSNHNLLSSTHPDTTTASPTRGDLVVANSSSSWARFGVGASNSVLTANGTDPAWSATPTVTTLTATGTVTGLVISATSALQVGSDYILDITGSGLSLTGGALTSTAAGAAGGDLTGTYPNPTITTNAVALGTDTTNAYVADLTAGTAIDVTGGGGETATITVDVDTTEVEATTWGAGGNTTNTWTYNLSGTDPTLIFGSNTVTGPIVAASVGFQIAGDIISDFTGTDLTVINGALTVDLLPDLSGTLDVNSGGTGVATLAANGVLYGNTTGAVLVTAQGGANTVLTANAGAPSFSASPTVTSLTATGTVTGAVVDISTKDVRFSALTSGYHKANSSGVVTIQPTPISLPDGGTGATSFTSNGVLYGNSTGTLLVTAQGAANTVLTANAGAPSFSATPTVTSLTATNTVTGASVDISTTSIRFSASAMNCSGYGSGGVLTTRSDGTLVCQADDTSAGTTVNSFETWSVPAGTNPVADSSTDTATFTEGLALDITGTAGTDTIDFALDPTELTGSRTFGDATTDTIVWTWDRATGTDPTITFGSNTVTGQIVAASTGFEVNSERVIDWTGTGISIISGALTVAGSPSVTNLTATNTVTGVIAVDTPRLENSTTANGGLIRVIDSILSTGTVTGTTVAMTSTKCTGTDKLTTDSNGNLICATDQAGGGTSHNVLSATHSDSVATSATRGDLIVANSTPNWARFAVGASNTVLTANGTDPAWSTTPTVTSLTASTTVTGTNVVATSTLTIPSGTAVNVGAIGLIGLDTTSGQIVVNDNTTTDGNSIKVITTLLNKCATIENLVAADDGVPIYIFENAATIYRTACYTTGFTTNPTYTLEDNGGNAVTGAATCNQYVGNNNEWTSTTAGNKFNRAEVLRLNTTNTPAPTTSTLTTVCWVYTTDRQ